MSVSPPALLGCREDGKVLSLRWAGGFVCRHALYMQVWRWGRRRRRDGDGPAVSIC